MSDEKLPVVRLSCGCKALRLEEATKRNARGDCVVFDPCEAHAPVWCLCGHAKPHHDFSLGAIRHVCEWRGCGCPGYAI